MVDIEKTMKNKILQMQPHVEKLIDYYKNYDIQVLLTDGKLENVVFTKGDDIYKIAWHCFYRISGLCYVQKGNIKENKKNKNKENSIELVYVTDDMFINIYMKSIINKHFNIV
jgi:hypothetical protein